MRAIVQRVAHASVTVDGEAIAKIGKGLLVLIGVEDCDSQEDASWLAGKIAKMRLFDDAEGVMNLSVNDIGGDLIAVSQFTLFASTKKGNRPSYIRASKPEIAVPLYEHFVSCLQSEATGSVQTGRFGADMKVELLNDGRVTIYIDTQDKE